jgi:hypothetical protein
MSMNLHCKEVELWQTPTYITNMCFYQFDRSRDGWRNILYRYLEWVKHFSDGVWESEEEYNDMRERIKDHIIELNSFSELHFYIM